MNFKTRYNLNGIDNKQEVIEEINWKSLAGGAALGGLGTALADHYNIGGFNLDTPGNQTGNFVDKGTNIVNHGIESIKKGYYDYTHQPTDATVPQATVPQATVPDNNFYGRHNDIPDTPENRVNNLYNSSSNSTPNQTDNYDQPPKVQDHMAPAPKGSVDLLKQVVSSNNSSSGSINLLDKQGPPTASTTNNIGAPAQSSNNFGTRYSPGENSRMEKDSEKGVF